MSLSRRTLAAARQRVRDDPASVVELVVSLCVEDAADGEKGALTTSQATALAWWWCTHEDVTQ